jgi:hypothetical protein
MSTPDADIWERGKIRIRYVKGLRRSEIVYPVENLFENSCLVN